jgi:hypothetical protein
LTLTHYKTLRLYTAPITASHNAVCAHLNGSASDSLDWTATGDNKSTTYFDGESCQLVLMLHLQLLVMKPVVLGQQIDSWH